MYEFKAFSGFRLDFFSASVCDGSPCLNGGTCSVSAGGTADCACVPGYSGATCAGGCITNLNLTLNRAFCEVRKLTSVSITNFSERL